MNEDVSEMNDETDDNEELELILEGSELHNYFKSYQDEGIDIYHTKNGHLPEENPFIKEKSPKTLVPKEIVEFTNNILHSNLLMEEDAAYLLRISSELIVGKQKFMHSRKWACGIFLLDLISVYCHLKYKSLGGVLLPVIAGSTVLLTFMLNKFLTTSSYNSQLKQLINVLQRTYVIVRKTIRAITEDDSLLASKEKLQWPSRPNNDIQQENSFKRKINEMAIMISKTARAMKNLILVAQSTTFSLMKICSKTSFRNDDYIAFCSNEKLGINGNSDDDIERMYNVAKLHNLKDIYLLMQSECLRLLGICFCQCSDYKDIKDVFKVLRAYSNESSCVLNLLKNEYEAYFYQKIEPKDTRKPKAKNFEEIVLIHDLCRTLNGLLIDARRLEEFVNESESSQEIYEVVTSRINQIEKEFIVTLETLKRVKEYYLKNSVKDKPNMQDQTLRALIENNGNLTRTNVTVGYSDFSISGADEVYLGSSDGIQNFHTVNYEDFNEFKPPNTLIKELKVALVKKREEFEQREIKVLKSADEIEAYKSCSVDLKNSSHTTSVENDDENKNKDEISSSIFGNITGKHLTDSDKKPLHASKNDVQIDFPTDECSNRDQSLNEGSLIAMERFDCGSLQQNIALAASNHSYQWSNMKNVDYFEDEFSD